MMVGDTAAIAMEDPSTELDLVLMVIENRHIPRLFPNLMVHFVELNYKRCI